MIPINLEKQKNIRDLGDTETSEGRRIKRNKLIRSGRISGLSAADAALLLGPCRLRTVVDLRSARESEKRPEPQWGIVEFFRVPLLTDDQLGFTSFAAGSSPKDFNVVDTLIGMTGGSSYTPKQYLMDMYRNFITTKQAQSATRRFFELLLSHKEGALLYHCNGGKDRTGIITAFLLSVLRVPWEVIAADYMETNHAVKSWLEEKLKNVPEKYQSKQAQAVLRMMYLADADCLQAAYDEMCGMCGSPEGYLRQVIGLTDFTLEEIRGRFLV